MNSRKLAIAVMTTAFTATMVSAHLPSAKVARQQMGRPYQGSATSNTRGTGAGFQLDLVKTWDQNLEGNNARAGTSKDSKEFYAKHGDFKGTTQYWRGNWYPDKGDQPGEFADSGGTSAWGLINSVAFGEGKEYQWVGWNSNAEKAETKHDGTEYGLEDITVGDWGNQIDNEGPGAYLPTWRNGAEGAYTMIHDDIGAMNFETSVQPANDVAKDFQDIRVGWGMFVRDMDHDENGPKEEGEWAAARQMVMDGHEMLNHSWDHSSAADQWQSGYIGETLSKDDPNMPQELRGLTIGPFTGQEYNKTISFQIPYIRYVNGDVNQPEIKLSEMQSYAVSSDYAVDSMFVINGKDSSYEATTLPSDDDLWEVLGEHGWVDTIRYATGKIKPIHKYWKSEQEPKAPMLKIFCVPGWNESMYDINIARSKKKMDENIYDMIESPRFQPGKKTEYYVYPYDAYSKTTHDALKAQGMIAARGGAKSGFALPGDFYQPFRIDFDAFFMMDEDASWTLADDGAQHNEHQRISLKGLVDRVVSNKGYMIREFHACAAVDYWDDANDQAKGGWWGGISQSLYRKHFEYLDTLIKQHKLVVFTPTEAVKYRLTTNSVKSVDLSGMELTVSADGCLPEYQDEISVIVKFDEAFEVLAASYSDGTRPRYAPRKMDDTGKSWSVSVNPYRDGGKVTLSEEPHVGNLSTNVKATGLSFRGILNNKIALKLPAGEFTASLYSVSGRKIASTKVMGNGSKLVSTNLSTANLGAGMFILNVEKAGASVMQHKFMVK